jgi:hypothetical protein
MGRAKNKKSNLATVNSDREALKQLRADRLIDDARIEALEAKAAQQAERIAELEAAAVAQAATAEREKEKAVGREKEKLVQKVAAKDTMIAELRVALQARWAAVQEAEQARMGMGDERRAAVATAVELAAAEEKLGECKCGRGTWNEPKEGKNGRAWRCMQRKELRRAGAAFFADEASYTKRVAEEAVLHADTFASVLESKAVQRVLKAVAEEAIQAVQDHLDAVGLAVKVHSKVSWRGYRRLSYALSEEYDEDAYDSDEEEKKQIGTYNTAALYLQPSRKNGLVEELEVKMPRLPSRYMLRKQEIDICKKYGGFDISEDGLATTQDFDRVVQAEIEAYAEIIREMKVLVIQIMGDAFRMERCGKYVNFVVRVCGVHKISGHHTSCLTLAIWKGDDGYASMKERVASQFEAAGRLAARGVIQVPAAEIGGRRGGQRGRGRSGGCGGSGRGGSGGGRGLGGNGGRGALTKKRGRVLTSDKEVVGSVSLPVAHDQLVCHVIAGGDALATNSALALGGFGCKFSCNYCETPNDMFHVKPGTAESKKLGAKTRTFARAVALSHAKPEEWPLHCPVCGDITEEQWEAEVKKEKNKAWYSRFSLKHFAQQYQCIPLLRGVDHIDHAMCVLHVVLCIAGTIYKHAISTNVENDRQAVSINHYLHGYLKVYIGKAKVMSKGEAVAVLKRPSFVGSEAPKVLESMEMLMHLINYNTDEEVK